MDNEYLLVSARPVAVRIFKQNKSCCILSSERVKVCLIRDINYNLSHIIHFQEITSNIIFTESNSNLVPISSRIKQAGLIFVKIKFI